MGSSVPDAAIAVVDVPVALPENKDNDEDEDEDTDEDVDAEIDDDDDELIPEDSAAVIEDVTVVDVPVALPEDKGNDEDEYGDEDADFDDELLPEDSAVIEDVILLDKEPTIEGIMTPDGALVGFEILGKEELVVDVTKVEMLETMELAIVLMELVDKAEIELPLSTIEGALRDEITGWDEKPDPKEPTIEGALALDGMLIESEILGKEKPVVDVT